MPRPPAERPLRKVTLNLFDEDVTMMERIYGRGWSEIVRNLLVEHVADALMSKQKREREPFLEGDLEE